ncbi:PqqD family protein [Deinococcus multiflagellatus]|uniref:PqqD family protein n=1 Tax=Deinococcus multiflagellatus TaxID=1656887 RepID=A0ABW1ZI94_9DEIO|nr:PqqD family protein [Deinococcus multiflagellatus]MBZ9713242.1 PqqD family protein [Deinococcus multiflagellatus]
MWRAADDLLITDLDDELILMQASRGEMFGLNASGRVVWQALPAHEAQLAAALQQTFGLDAAQAQADVAALLADLQRRGLVQRS